MKKNLSSRQIKNRKKRIRALRLAAGITCLAVLLVSGGMIAQQFVTNQRRANMQQNLLSLYPANGTAQAEALPDAAATSELISENLVPVVLDGDTPEATQVPSAPSMAEANAAAGEGQEVQADFQELYAINNDLVAMLQVGNDIKLPVVYRDNEYYLHRDFYGNDDLAGTLFINEANTIWPADKNLLFHGHNMRSGAIFGDMDFYRELDYLKENVMTYYRTIYDAEPRAYVPVALFDMSANSGSRGYYDVHIKFDSDEAFVKYAQDTIDRSIYNLPFDVQADDELLTLFTCSYNNDNGRFLMVLRALRADETVEGVIELMQSATKK